MTDEIEGDIAEAPADTAPSSEPASAPAEADLSTEIRKAVDGQKERGPDGKFKGRGAQPPAGTEPGRGPAKGVATGNVGAVRSGVASNAEGPAQQHSSGMEAAKYTPPASFSVATKQAWDALPEHLKADIAKREADIDSGLKRFGGLSKFAEEAERNGTTLTNAVGDYVAVETELRKDFLGGVEFLCRRLGVQPQALLRGLAMRYGAPQEPGGQPQSPQNQQQFDPNAIAAHAANMVRTEIQQREINSQIDAFSANPSNRFFGNVRQDMSILVQAGKAADLQTAYEAACWLDPEIRAILIEEMAGGQNKAAVRTAAKAQNAAKAVSGAPSNSHAGEAPRPRNFGTHVTAEEVRDVVKAQRGAA
jgi:hypothetical protein